MFNPFDKLKKEIKFYLFKKNIEKWIYEDPYNPLTKDGRLNSILSKEFEPEEGSCRFYLKKEINNGEYKEGCAYSLPTIVFGCKGDLYPYCKDFKKLSIEDIIKKLEKNKIFIMEYL